MQNFAPLLLEQIRITLETFLSIFWKKAVESKKEQVWSPYLLILTQCSWDIYSSRFLPIFVYLLKLLFQDGFSLHFPAQIHVIISLGLDISENTRCSLYTLICIYIYTFICFHGIRKLIKNFENKQPVSHNYGLLIFFKTKWPIMKKPNICFRKTRSAVQIASLDHQHWNNNFYPS